MRAVILLKTNPGFHEKVKDTLKSSTTKGIKLLATVHCFGRFDGVMICDFSTLEDLNQYTERLRNGGVFTTETLLAIE